MSLFASGTGKGVKFSQVGARITGKIAQLPFEKQATKFGSQEPDFWPNGDPKMQVVVPLTDTDAMPEDANDDGDRTLYVSSTSMKKAIFAAISAAGASDVQIGGILTVIYTGDDPNSQNPANPKKLYSAQYSAPASGLAAPAPAAPAAAPAPAAPVYQQPAAVPAAPVQQVAQPMPAAVPQQAVVPAAPTPAPAPVVGQSNAALAGVTQEQHDKVKQLLALSIPPEQAAAAVGITVDQVATIAGLPF